MIRNAKQPLRIVGYCRTSTDRQEISLADQERKLRAYVEAHDGYQLTELVAAHESAASLKRDGLQRALALLASGEADGLLVLKLDRLCRSLRDLMQLVDLYFAHPKRPKTLVSIQDSIDTKSAGGRLVLSVLGSVAEWELATIRERITSALSFKRASGERTGTVPYGWDLADDAKTLTPNPQEQEALALMRRMRGDGASFRSIALELNAAGYRTKSGLATWSFATVAGILKRDRSDAA